jgi:hypothetical protein
MIKFSFWNHFREYGSTLGTEFVDERQIDAVYDKAKYAVKLVQLYDQYLPKEKRLLPNISTIATLDSGVYGMYTSADDKKFIDGQAMNKLRLKFGNDVVQSAIQNNTLSQLPTMVIKQYVPDIDTSQIRSSDIIHVNVRRHLMTHGDSLNALLEIASTIVHEATHEWERQNKGKTDEVGPIQAEKVFMNWVKSNWNMIIMKIPQLGNLQNSFYNPKNRDIIGRTGFSTNQI